MTQQGTDTSLAKQIGHTLASADAGVLARLGQRVVSVAPGSAEVEMVVADDMVNSHGMCHGGLIFSLADTAFAYAVSSRNAASVTLSMTMHFVRGAKVGERLRAVAEVVRDGRRTGVCDVVVVAGERLVAKATGTAFRTGGEVIEG